MSSGRAVLKKDRLEEERELLRRLLEKEGLTSGAQTTNGEAQEQPPPLHRKAPKSGLQSSRFPASRNSFGFLTGSSLVAIFTTCL
jgi:hypothetical protein